MLNLFTDIISHIKQPFKIMITEFSAMSHVDTISVNASTNASSGSFSINATVMEKILHVFISVEFKLQTERNVYGLAMLNKTIDVCRFFKKPESEPLVNIVYMAISSHGQGHIPRTCPIENAS